MRLMPSSDVIARLLCLESAEGVVVGAVIDSAIQGPNIEVVDANVEVVERRDRSGFALEDDIEVLTKV
ncbi:hypothetical protein HBH69_216790 [Parastagonospora nodorum]|nr:hypothetical protein HBH69_216790 [Parastagonospora nodorum]KAH5238393.1 hypothetical protein HBI71_234010 [Parastagonospora nodorum]KAH5297444.1 hypothetical protein HBI12_207560 [Parastagonospora nodorum]KAH5487373.1 hypothetical protein HBI52_239030 [Parastagonospora nodorum]KAH6242416.1 hypothetical protein HBI42_233340 [Parastagonospora nodorum]